MANDQRPPASARSLQETYAPHNTCFGCGPANEKGLHIRSFAVSDREAVAEWTPQPHHEAFPGMLNGGIIGALLDCHSNWTAAWHLMRRNGAATPPCTVTADYAIKLLRPTPTSGPVKLVARVAESSADRAVIEAELRAVVPVKDAAGKEASGKDAAVKDAAGKAAALKDASGKPTAGEEKTCATCRGTFVAVKPGHPAYHRW